MSKSHLFALSLLALLAVAAGCKTAETIAAPITKPITGSNAFQVTESELKNRLASFGYVFLVSTDNAVTRVLAERDDVEMRRFCLRWRNRAFIYTRVMQQHTDPRVALLDYWAICYLVSDFFSKGPGKDFLGPHNVYAEEVYGTLLHNYTELVEGVLPKKHFEPTKARIEEFAVENPVTGLAIRSTSLPSDSKGGFGSALSLSLGVSQGLDATAAEVHRMTDMLEVIPYQLRLNVEHLLLDHAAVEMQDDISKIADSMNAMQRTTDELPHEIGEEVRKTIESAQEPLKTTLDQTNEALVSVKDTMKEARGIVTEAKETVGEVNQTVDKATLALDKFKQAGEAWKPTIEELNKLAGTADSGAAESAEGVPSEEEAGSTEDEEAGGSESDDAAPGSDSGADPNIENIVVALEELNASAKELRGLIGDANELIGSSELTERIDEVDNRAQGAIDHTTMRVGDLIGSAARWGIALIVIFFGALFAYRVALSRAGKAAA